MQSFEDFWSDVCTYKLEIKYPFNKLKLNIHCSNGCGAKGGLPFPSTFWGVSILATCTNHDIEWKLAENHIELIEANYRWRRNMERIIDQESANRFMIYLRLKRMNKYYNAVKLIGTQNYADERGFLYTKYNNSYLYDSPDI